MNAQTRAKVAAGIVAVAAVATTLILLTTATKYRLYLPLVTRSDVVGKVAAQRGAAMPHQTQVCDDVILLRATWWYNWTLTPNGCNVPGFVAMAWNGNVGNYKCQSGEILLGPNEPNYSDQSNITPEQVFAKWGQLEKTGCILGAPAVGHCEWNIPGCVDDGWLERFMVLCKDCRIDFMPLHYYGCDSNKLFAYLDKRWNQYHKPIWLTEWACPYRIGDAEKFMREVLPKLTMYHVVAHSWFGARVDPWTDYESLVDKNGALTKLGRIYVQ